VTNAVAETVELLLFNKETALGRPLLTMPDGVDSVLHNLATDFVTTVKLQNQAR
jgi:hypothetical protein